jgi:ATP-dependent Lon protease
MTMSKSLPTTFALLPLRSGVLFPGTTMSLPVGRPRSVKLIEDMSVGDIIGVAVQRNPKTDEPVLADLHPVGTLARIRKIHQARDGQTYRVTLEGVSRFELDEILGSDPYWRAAGRAVDETGADSPESELLFEELRQALRPLARGGNDSLREILSEADEPGVFADRIASGLDVDRDREIEVLLTLDVPKRLRLCARLIAEAKARHELKQKIGEEVRRELSKDQREAVLRQQLRAIQKELGEGRGGGNEELEKLQAKLEKAELPEEVQETVDRELRKLQSLNPAAPDANVTRNYLEWIADMPWNERAEVKEDIDAVGAKLDEDHFGLDKVKERILQHLAVLQLTGNPRGNIMCLVGPPGVGKTSLGQSIADATGRPFIRVALGGVRDEAEIRGHRRTYVGALPGRLVAALRKVKVKNPVIMLDEVDKLGQGWMGSPEHALLEVLDPQQNSTFTDHYLEVPFDLSEVLFIATANSLEPLSAPLRDRMEIVSLGGYTTEEKKEIAKAHLLPKQLSDHALEPGSLELSDEMLNLVIRDYTREAGVRQLNRELNRLCRALALESVRSSGRKNPKVVIDEAALRKHLGKAKFFNEVAERTSIPGVATGLAYTSVGGDILFIETSKMKGKGGVQITGKLGDVMQESAKAALTYVRSNAELLGVDPDDIAEHDIHIHVPAGATPKDGPSAGVTMFTALTSLFTGRKVRPDTAMTGECSLRGRVLPVGGIKEKVVAAHRAGIRRVILPAKNERDLDDVPETVRDDLEFIIAHDMTDVLHAALEPAASGLTPDDSSVTASA